MMEREKEVVVKIPENRSSLKQMRESRLRRLGEIGPVLAGSLAKRKGQGGYYLTDKVEGKTRTVHVSEQMEPRVRGWIENHRKAKRLLEELSEIQRALMKMERD